MTKVVAIIPARGGSKGLKRKNIRRLAGRTLIDYTISAARNASVIDRIFVSTEDNEIAEKSKELGAEILNRPTRLADDITSSNAVLAQACEFLAEQGAAPDIVVYLQATDIFRPTGLIERCVEAVANSSHIDSAFAAYDEHKNFWLDPENPQRILPLNDRPRQTKPSLYREDTGLACAIRFDTLRHVGRIGNTPHIVPHAEEFAKIDIHTEEDLWMAEMVVRKFEGERRFAYQL